MRRVCVYASKRGEHVSLPYINMAKGTSRDQTYTIFCDKRWPLIDEVSRSITRTPKKLRSDQRAWLSSQESLITYHQDCPCTHNILQVSRRLVGTYTLRSKILEQRQFPNSTFRPRNKRVP